jgi:uncharacterized RDD family membrane protein YckC
MKCPECGYTSFDYLEECKKCGAALSPVPIFKYLYEDELSTEVVIGREKAPVPSDVFTQVEMVEAVSELAIPRESRSEDLAESELENFLRFERDPGEEFSEEKKEEKESSPPLPKSSPPLPNGMVPATFGERIFAFSVDLLFTLCVAAVALFSGANLIGETFFPGLGEFVSIWGWICLCVYVLATTYFIFLPYWCGTTLGNAAAGIRVVRQDGSLAGPQANFLRWAGWVFSVATVFLGFALALSDPQRKTFSDRLCGTFVVRT